jgi:hypothetical protein
MELILLLIATAPSVQTSFKDWLYYSCACGLEFMSTGLLMLNGSQLLEMEFRSFIVVS